jgi:hypothetical protein
MTGSPMLATHDWATSRSCNSCWIRALAAQQRIDHPVRAGRGRQDPPGLGPGPQRDPPRDRRPARQDQPPAGRPGWRPCRLLPGTSASAITRADLRLGPASPPVPVQLDHLEGPPHYQGLRSSPSQGIRVSAPSALNAERWDEVSRGTSLYGGSRVVADRDALSQWRSWVSVPRPWGAEGSPSVNEDLHPAGAQKPNRLGPSKPLGSTNRCLTRRCNFVRAHNGPSA